MARLPLQSGPPSRWKPAGPALLGVLLLALVAGQARAAGPKDGASRCPGPAVEDAIARVETTEIVLGSGRRIMLADIRLPDLPPPAAAAAAAPATPVRPDGAAWLRSLAGRPVAVAPAGPPDRWERSPAVVALREDGRDIDLADLLVAEGLALVDPGERDGLCRPALRGAEAQARRGRLGMWDRDDLVLAADRPDALRAASGRFALVGGRIVSVGERRDRTYLNFGRDFSRDFAIVVPKRIWADMKRSGHSAESLRGRTILARGLLETRRAPVMEITGADMLDLSEPGTTR